MRSLANLLSILVIGFGAVVSSTKGTPDVPLSTRSPRYRLCPGDSVKVSYRLTPEYDAAVQIQPDGFVTLPLLGEVQLGGLTLAEISQSLKAKAAERLNGPEVDVTLTGFEAPSVVVGGEVGSPGRFPIRGHVTALRAVQIAGGFKSSAKASQVLLIRPVNDVDGQTKLLDLRTTAGKQPVLEDVELRPGDLLIVPKTRIARIEPLVKLINTGIYLNPLGF